MGQWLVTQGSNQFSADSLGELEGLAREGRLQAGDMIQPPGTTEWMYISEVPELQSLLNAGGQTIDDDDDFGRKRGFGGASTGLIAAALLALIIVGGIAIFTLAQQLPRGDQRLIGGAGGLTFSQMIVTQMGSGLHASPEASAALSHPVPKDAALELLAKRGDWYRARNDGGQEGWIPSNHVIPMYQLGGADVRDEFDPLYNPDRYVEVMSARWMQLPADNPRPGAELSNRTVFEFMMKNESRYLMSDLVILATIKDAKGHELETVEIPIDGILPSEGRTMVGTLAASDEVKGEEPVDRLLTNYTFEELSRDEPDLQLRWSSGVEVEMNTDSFTNAEIDVLELRALPDDEAAEEVRRN